MSSTLNEAQFGRQISLIVAPDSGSNGLELSEFRIVFTVQHYTTETPTTLAARVYNLAPNTIARIQKEFTQVVLRAGYQSNFGIIFSGTIKETRSGRESATDTYLDIFAADNDEAHNWGIINTTLAAGWTPEQVNQAVAKELGPLGITVKALPSTVTQKKAPRSKVLYGQIRDHLRGLAQTHALTYTVRGGVLEWLPVSAYAPGEAIKLNSMTGLIGIPTQTEDGINVRCLLNPALGMGRRVQINNADIQKAQVNLAYTSIYGNIKSFPSIARDGIYKVIFIDHHGDTRGNDWYSDFVCLAVDATVSPITQAVLGVGIPP